MNKKHIKIKATPKYIEYLLEFKNSSGLTECILMLYNGNFDTIADSMLYQMPDSYHLIIKAGKNALFPINIAEYCDRFSSSATETEYTKEYGKILIKSSAIKIYGKAFKKP